MDRSWAPRGGRAVDLDGPETRAERTVTALFARHNVGGVAASDPAASVQWVCRTAEQLLGMDAACVSLIVGGSYRGVLEVTDPVLRRIEASQFALGVGPCLDAADRGVPVLLPDFATEAGSRWPVLAGQLASLTVPPQVGAFYAFPLSCGEERLGALAMYRREPARLPSDVLAAATALARLAALVLVCTPVTDPDLVEPELVRHAGHGPGSAAETTWVETVLRDQTVVELAVGIVMAGLGVHSEPALARLRAYAFAIGKDLVEVADELTSHRLHPGELDS